MTGACSDMHTNTRRRTPTHDNTKGPHQPWSSFITPSCVKAGLLMGLRLRVLRSRVLRLGVLLRSKGKETS